MHPINTRALLGQVNAMNHEKNQLVKTLIFTKNIINNYILLLIKEI